MNDDESLLASRLLDGDATAGERSRLQVDPALQAEVGQLRIVRALLSDVDEPVISMRERHLSAALDAWDRLPEVERTKGLRDATPNGADGAAAAGLASISTPSGSRSRSNRRRFQSSTWLGAAAAGLVLVLAGGLILQSRTTNDDSSSDAASLATADTQAVPTAAADSAGNATRSSESKLEVAAAEAGAAPSDAAPSENASEVETDIDAAAPPPDDEELELLTSPEDLAIFASDALDSPSSSDLPDNASVVTEAPTDTATYVVSLPVCLGVDRIVGLANYNGEPVVVGIDERRSLALAYRELDCSEVARASLR